MINQFANIKKLLLLGFAVVSTKVMLLLFAYFFDSDTYNLFNQIYYTASVIILFGSLGFNIAVTRIKIKPMIVTAAVAFNSLLIYLFLQIISTPFTNIFQIVSILIYSILISISGIYVFQLLFSSRYNEYVLLTLLYSFLHLMIIPAIIYFNVDLFIILPIVSFLWLVIGMPKFIKENKEKFNGIKEFYKLGISAFIINSAVSLALAADKYFANHFFTQEIANSYTFSWSLTAPIFYIGVIIEQFLFAETNTSKSNILKKGFLFSMLLVVVYAVSMLFAINFFPNLIPDSVNYYYVIKISSLMIGGYSIYVIFHFPVNAYLFKSLSTEKQKSVSLVFGFIILAFVVLYTAIMQDLIGIDYIGLLIITWSYIFTLLISKVLIMFRKDAGETNYESILEIKNLEP